ncbi:anti-sigma-factor antagonist [Fictibacillus macauensis ZFHKF-1]|uniref:Anti-sigma-factor antagonist n=1 Tax=Fictibacillus macauensis ZFHKF-1 TaxID=1196324 RepID=I8J1T3_9BACL|nr:STAS domain-containing protein [Fictibacillus macauensis]EIT85696.1 anti-sigma-factor antagonist [Fictibacillus macauensis ZFHKF-1]
MSKEWKQELVQYIIRNRENFKQQLLAEAVNVASEITNIQQTGNINLIKNAEKLALCVIKNREDELISFAKKEGIVWAEHALTITLKLEWVHAIRRTLWHFLHAFDSQTQHFKEMEDYRTNFYEMEILINDSIDQFLNGFFISYSSYKDNLLNEQRKMVEHLSVPIIPLSKNIAVLPLIGRIDAYRMQIIEEKVLTDISTLKISTLIMDLSGLTDMDIEVMHQFEKVLLGISLMGSSPVITGLRAELVHEMIQLGLSFEEYATVKGTLEQTLAPYFTMKSL